MAPEQCDPRSFGPVTPAADIWGLGRDALSRRGRREPVPRGRPRLRRTRCVRWPQLADTPVPIEGRVPDPIAATITACLAADPAQRPAPAEVAEVLERLLEAQPKPKLAALKPRWR